MNGRPRRILRARFAVAALLASVVTLGGGGARSQPATGPSTESASKAAAESKALNKEGIALLDAGDRERALEYFLKSRAILPTSKNTTNAAIVLQQLGRYDEALELYEQLLLKYAGGLDDEDRAAIGPAMAALRKKVGSVNVSSNVGGSVTVDGRPRGTLPLSTPLRVLAGKHRVRIFRTGYEPFESSIELAEGEATAVDARLVPLKGVGQLVVEKGDPGAADVFIDGVHVGATPWEGTLPPGKHMVWLRSGDSGSSPTPVQVLQGQAALVRPQMARLGPAVTLRVDPRDAAFEVGGVALGTGTWQGRLPAGSYAIIATEPGYKTATQRVDLREGDKPVELVLHLEVDPNHPRWPRVTGTFWLEGHGGVATGSSLGADAEAKCTGGCDPSVLGMIAGARVGYRFPFGGSLELGGGYMMLNESFERTFRDDRTKVTYTLEDELRVRGPFFAGGLSYRRGFGRFFAQARASFGILVASSSDPVTGTASTGGATTDVVLEKRNESATSGAPFLMPEIAAGLHLGPIEIAATMAVGFFPANGPVLERGRFGPRTKEGVSQPGAVDNAQESDAISNERAYGGFVVFVPGLSAGGAF